MFNVSAFIDMPRLPAISAWGRRADSQINLEPGFTATAAFGSTGILFHAIIAPLITISSLPSGALGSAYSQTLAAAGGSGPYTWFLV